MNSENAMRLIFTTVAFVSVVSMLIGYHMARGEHLYAICGFVLLGITAALLEVWLSTLAAKVALWEAFANGPEEP